MDTGAQPLGTGQGRERVESGRTWRISVAISLNLASIFPKFRVRGDRGSILKALEILLP